MKKQCISITNFCCFIVSITSLFFAIIILQTSSKGDKSILLFLLPLFFSISNAFSYKLYKKFFKSPVTQILILLYFIRFCLSPTMFVLGGCVFFFPVSFSNSSFFYAIIIMCAEVITVFYIANKYVDTTCDRSFFQLKYKSNKSTSVFFLSFILLLFILITYFMIPEIQQVNIFLFNVEWEKLASIDYDNETIVARGSITRYLFSLWSFLWPILRIIISPLFMSFFYSKINNKHLSFFLSASSVILPCLFIGADNISPFIGIILGIITLHHLYGKKSNYIIVFFSIAAAILLGIIISSKAKEFQIWRGSSGISLFAQLLNQYFPGVENGALTLDLPKSNYLEHIFFDFYYAVPFKETLLGLDGTRLNDLFSSYVRLKGAITPFIFQISYYFTGVGGCVFVGLFVRMAYKYEMKAFNSDTFWNYYVNMYASFLITSSISIYSFSIYFRNVIGIYVPIKVLLFFVKKISIKKIGNSYDQRET